MNKTFCDICEKEIVGGTDIRHINITKDVDGKDSPTMVEKEACVACAEIVKKCIVGMEAGL